MAEGSVGDNIIYEIRVRNHLDDYWHVWFEGMAITDLENGDALIRGPIVDQSALYGILARIRELNLTLIYIRKVS